ncbi:MAG: APC family permease [Thermoanaerobaculia bacterium]|nr:APC family permease [Thermoanaerobaculia bacterium]
MQAASGAGLRRAVSRWQVVALALNDVVGSGVYLLPAAAAALLGFASLWAVALAGLAVLLIVLCFAEASSRFDEPGGAYLYTRTAFGPLAGFEVGWMTWLARVASVGSLSAGFADALSFLWPQAATPGAARAVAITLPLLALTLVNLVGVRSGALASVVLVLAKLAPLALFVGVGLFVASPELAAAQPVLREGGLGAAALLLLYAYAGFENTPAPAGEYKSPRRDVPFALLVHIGLVTALYAAVQWVALGTVPQLGTSTTPLADAAQRFLGGWGGWALAVGGAVSILGTNGNTVLAGPRYLYALACDGFGPRFLARVHPRFRTPAAAILLQTAIALPLALTGTFVGLAALSVVARLATYVGTAAAVPVLRRLGPGEAGFRLPGGPLIPAAAIALSLGLAASATPRNLAAAGVALLAGLGVYALRRRDAATRRPPSDA